MKLSRIRNSLPTIAALGWLLLAFTGCQTETSHASGANGNEIHGKLSLSGSSTLAPMMAEIAKRFEELHPSVRIDVQTGGSSRGIQDTEKGIVDIGMASRELNKAEEKTLQSQTVAWDGVAFAIHKDNPVMELTDHQLKSIYTGAVTNWQEIGGHNAPIVVSNRATGRSELDLVTQYLKISIGDIKANIVDGETQQSIKSVSGNKNVITYTSIGAAQYSIDAGESLKLLPLNGVPATTQKVQRGQFPLARPLLLLHRAGEPSSLVSEFIEFAKSSVSDDITEGLGYVPPKRADLTGTSR